MMSSKRLSQAMLLSVAMGSAGSSFGVTTVTSGSFAAEVQRLKGLAFDEGSGSYVVPTSTQLSSFQTLASGLWSGAYLGTASTSLDTQASALGYEYVRFTDTDSGQILYGLREKLTSGVQTKGWGSYFVNFNAVTDTITEVPHTRFDTNTEEMGGKTFVRAATRGFMLAGANRYTNDHPSSGYGIADVAHRTNSVFEKVHEAFAGPTANTTGWSVHGFDISGFPEFPAGTDVVASSCDAGVSDDALALNSRYEALGFTTYAYNALAATNPRNVQVNGTYDGSTFSGLGGSSNVQSQYSTSKGGRFMHAEHEQSIRFSSTNRDEAASAMGDAMRDGEAMTVNNLRRWDGGSAGTSTSWGVSDGTSWNNDAMPQATDTVFFDNTYKPALPSSMTFTAVNMTVRGFVWNSNDSSAVVSATTGSSSSTMYLLGNAAESTWDLLQMGSLATSSTFTFTNDNTSTGTGKVKLMLNASGPINVVNAGATLDIECMIDENLTGRRLEKKGAGLLILGNSSNGMSGGLTFSAGTVSTAGVTATGAAPASAIADYYRFNGGAWKYNGGNVTASSTRGITVTANGGTLDIISAATLTLNGIIAGSGPLYKSGAGSLALNNVSSTFSGTHVVQNGYLVPAVSGAFGSASANVLVQTGGSVLLRAATNYLTPTPLTLNGQGVSNTGALQSTSGDTHYAGVVNINTDAAISVPSGTLSLDGGIAGSGSLTVKGAGVLNAPRFSAGALSITNPVVAITSARSISNTSRLTALSIGSNALDLALNDLIIDYSGASPLADVRAMLLTGYASGAWSGQGIRSSAAALTGSTLGFAEASDLGIGSFNTQSVDSTAIVIRYTAIGDANLDGSVDSLDFTRLLSGFGGSTATWANGDFNYDSKVNTLDFNDFAGHFGAAVPSPVLGSVVPEPGCLAAVACVAAFGFQRRRFIKRQQQ